MHATIAPSVTAYNANEYRTQMERIASFATRVHIDVGDGIFTPVKTIGLDQVWWPGGVRADLHVMYQRPLEHAPLYLSLTPQMVIVHAEADGDFLQFSALMHHHGIEVGVALKPETPVALIAGALDAIDHVLVFSGTLGHFGGQADLSLLTKVKELKRLKPQLEVSWDGGVNADNARAIAQAGTEVIISGGFVQHAKDPAAAYHVLQRAAGSTSHTGGLPASSTAPLPLQQTPQSAPPGAPVAGSPARRQSAAYARRSFGL